MEVTVYGLVGALIGATLVAVVGIVINPSGLEDRDVRAAVGVGAVVCGAFGRLVARRRHLGA